MIWSEQQHYSSTRCDITLTNTHSDMFIMNSHYLTLTYLSNRRLYHVHIDFKHMQKFVWAQKCNLFLLLALWKYLTWLCQGQNSCVFKLGYNIMGPKCVLESAPNQRAVAKSPSWEVLKHANASCYDTVLLSSDAVNIVQVVKMHCDLGAVWTLSICANALNHTVAAKKQKKKPEHQLRNGCKRTWSFGSDARRYSQIQGSGKSSTGNSFDIWNKSSVLFWFWTLLEWKI